MAAYITAIMVTMGSTGISKDTEHELDYYFKNSPYFLKRLDLIKAIKDSRDQFVGLMSFRRQFKMLEGHTPVLLHYVKTGVYKPELSEKGITLVDYSRGLVLNSHNKKSDYDKYYASCSVNTDGKPAEGLHLIIDGDVNITRLRSFITKNSKLIKTALAVADPDGKIRFTPIVRIDDYIRMADEYYSFPEGERPTHLKLEEEYNITEPDLSNWLDRLKPLDY